MTSITGPNLDAADVRVEHVKNDEAGCVARVLVINTSYLATIVMERRGPVLEAVPDRPLVGPMKE